MARFRATIQGSRGQASRLGHRNLHATINGWQSGVTVDAGTENRSKDGNDTFEVWMTGGSGYSGARQLLGTVRLVDGEPQFEPSAYTVEQVEAAKVPA